MDSGVPVFVAQPQGLAAAQTTQRVAPARAGLQRSRLPALSCFWKGRSACVGAPTGAGSPAPRLHSMGIPKDVGKYTQVNDQPVALVHYAARSPFVSRGQCAMRLLDARYGRPDACCCFLTTSFFRSPPTALCSLSRRTSSLSPACQF